MQVLMHAAMLAHVCHLHVCVAEKESSQAVVMGDVEEAVTEVMDEDQLDLEQLHDSAARVSPQRPLKLETSQ